MLRDVLNRKNMCNLFVLVLAIWSGYGVCQQTYRGVKDISKAVKDNDLPGVKQLLKINHDLVFYRDDKGFTPLHLAAANGYESIVEFLLAAKADVKAKDNFGSTPLHQATAAYGEQRGIVELLIAHKADVNATDRHGLTPLHIALIADNPKVAKILLNRGADPNVRDNVAGHTPLILAAAKGYREVTEALLMHGAKVNLADDRGTPLTWAIRTDHTSVAGLLRQHGGHE